MADAELQREAFVDNRPRWRWLRRLIVAALVAMLSAAVAWMVAVVVVRDHVRDEMVAEQSEPPAHAVAMPAPAPLPAPAPVLITLPAEPGGALGPCPAFEPARDAAVGVTAIDAADEWRQRTHVLTEHGALVGVTAAQHRPGWLAAWNHEDIYLSTDDGRTFTPVLEAPGHIDDVAIDCHGRVFALRDGRMLGVRHGARESWQVIQLFDRDEAARDRGPRMVADGGLVALAGPSRNDINAGVLSVSVDGGATWRQHDLAVSGSWEGVVTMHVDGGGRLRVVSRWGDCMVEGSTGHLYDPRTARLRVVGEYDPYPREEAVITDDGWVYMPASGCGGDSAVCAWTPGGKPRVVTGVDAGPEQIQPRVIAGADHALWLLGGRVYRLEHGRARRLADDVSMEEQHAVDPAGRLLGFDDGMLVRWSPRHGKRILTGQRRPESQ